MKWITRERPRVDRVACPWLIERFIDTDAEFAPTAMLARGADAALIDFACFDVQLREAARGEGFALLPMSV